MIISAKFSAVM